MRSSSITLINFFSTRSCFDNKDINFESNFSGQENGNKLILTVFFLLGDLYEGLSDGLLVLDVKVFESSVLECSICSLSSSCSAISFSVL